jgi:hypothetical protein
MRHATGSPRGIPGGNVTLIRRDTGRAPGGDILAQGESRLLFPVGNTGRAMGDDRGKGTGDGKGNGTGDGCASGLAARFGALLRDKRQAMGLRQEDIAFATGYGRRFVIELEAGKATCQLGKALAVAAAVGLRPLDVMALASGGRVRLQSAASAPATAPPSAREPARG